MTESPINIIQLISLVLMLLLLGKDADNLSKSG